MKLVRRAYGREYFESVLFREKRQSQRNRNRLSLLPEDICTGRLLEIGCGTGGFLELARLNFDVACVDISSYAVERVRAVGIPAEVADIQEAKLPPGNNTVVAAFNVLEHLAQPQKALAAIFTSLAPGGVLVGSVPNNGGVAGRTATFLMNTFDKTHVFTPPPAVWRELLLGAGFEQVQLLGEVNFGPSHSLLVRGLLWRQLAFNMMFVARKAQA